MKEIMEALLKLQEAQIRAELKPGEENSTTRKWRKAVPKPVQGHFDRLRSRGKKGIAVIRNGTCTGCYIKVALGVMLTLRNETDIQLCGNCGRYLLLPAEEVIGHGGRKSPGQGRGQSQEKGREEEGQRGSGRLRPAEPGLLSRNLI